MINFIEAEVDRILDAGDEREGSDIFFAGIQKAWEACFKVITEVVNSRIQGLNSAEAKNLLELDIGKIILFDNPEIKHIKFARNIIKHSKSEIQFERHNQIVAPRGKINLDSFDLDIFQLKTQYPDTLELLSFSILDHWNLFSKSHLNLSRFPNFIFEVMKGYKPIPYHNSLHAADVLQCSHLILLPQNLKLPDLSDTKKLSFLIAAIIHDFKHPGLTNVHLSKYKHKIATRYNDISILENYHLAQFFKLLQNPELNIFDQIEDISDIRKLIIRLVIHTDIAYHAFHEAQCVRIRDNQEISEDEMLEVFMHVADLSNVCRKGEVSRAWGIRINQEMAEMARHENIRFGASTYDENIPVNRHQYKFSCFVMPMFKSISQYSQIFQEFYNGLQYNIRSITLMGKIILNN